MHGTKIGLPEHYREHTIQVTRYPPDFLCYVDGQRVGNQWIDAAAARAAGVRYVDQVEDEAAKAAK